MILGNISFFGVIIALALWPFLFSWVGTRRGIQSLLVQTISVPFIVLLNYFPIIGATLGETSARKRPPFKFGSLAPFHNSMSAFTVLCWWWLIWLPHYAFSLIYDELIRLRLNVGSIRVWTVFSDFKVALDLTLDTVRYLWVWQWGFQRIVFKEKEWDRSKFTHFSNTLYEPPRGSEWTLSGS